MLWGPKRRCRTARADREIAPHTVSIEVGDEGERFLICSDGLSDCVEFAMIQKALNEPTPAGALNALFSAAAARGLVDNVSAVVMDVSVNGGAP
jgi:serine/threonine protein phosphatase PrpC